MRRTIALTPLIDVVFILLLFFVLTSQFDRRSAVVVDVPSRATSAAASNSRTVLVRLRGDDRVLIDGAPERDVDAIASAPALLVALTDDVSITVRPEDGVTLQPIVTLMDALAAMGFADVAFVGMR